MCTQGGVCVQRVTATDIHVRQKWLEYAQKGICGKKTLATLVRYEHFEKVYML